MISLIIPCYWETQGLIETTKNCIRSLQDTPLDELIVIDDGSRINAEIMLREWKPWQKVTKFIRREDNGGYSKASNDGLRASQGDIIIIGNNDLVFTENWLRGLLKVLEEGFDIATCWTSDQNYILDDVIREGDKFGSLFAMNREVYEKLGGFDEQFKGYFADTDYRQRAKDAGFRIGINQGLVINHLAKATYKVTDPNDDEFLKAQRLYEAKYGYAD